MTKKWSPVKEHKGPQHLNQSYLDNVMKDNAGKNGVRGTISNVGNGSEDGATFPTPPQKDKVGKNNGKSPW